MTALSWAVFSEQAPEIAKFGQQRIDGKVSYLATVRESGEPRIHPVTALVGEGSCFIFAEPDSSKVRDFRYKNQFTLHCAMSDSSGSSGEFQMSGLALFVDDEDVRRMAESICHYRPASSYQLYELKISEAMSNCYRGGRANRKRWRGSD